jgi:type I restriction enzyme S subunit
MKNFKLSDLFWYINDGTHQTPRYIDNGTPFYSVENVVANDFLKNIKYVSLEDSNLLNKRCQPEIGDILLTRIGTLGISKMIDWKYGSSIYVSLALLKPKKDVDVEYIYAFMKSNIFLKRLKRLSLINAVPQKINTMEIKKIDISYFEESFKRKTIVDIIESIDRHIDSLVKQYTKQFQIFEGLLHIIFTSNGLFKVPLSSIVVFNKGSQINGDQLSDQYKYPMYNGGMSYSGYTNEYNTISKSIIISEGGNSCGYVNYIESDFWAGGHCYVVTSKGIDSLYSYFLLKYHEKEIMGLRVGSGLPNIQKKALYEYEVMIESDTKTQNTIGLKLFDYYKSQKSFEKKINKYKNIREGLLEGLFSGKIEVPNLSQQREGT